MTSLTDSASTRQTFAIFCALKIDVRACDLSRAQASHILERANAGEFAKGLILAEVSALPGAVTKGTARTVPVKTGGRNFPALYSAAWQAGVSAATACVPVPMQVVQRANPLDDRSPVVHAYAPVMDGVCGFASVKFAGNTAFGKWAKRKGYARAAYGGGLSVWIGDYNQSLQKKEAHAYAMAGYLSANGIPANGESRID